MSKYNSFVRRVDEIARKHFAEYAEALQQFNQAKAAYDAHPYRGHTHGIIDAESAASLASAQAEHLKAKARLDAAKSALLSSKQAVRNVQREFRIELEKDVRIDPAALDMAALEVLKSGIMRPEEYGKMLSDYTNNPTMARMIGSYAKQAAAQMNKPEDADARRFLHAAVEQSKKADGSELIEGFDNLCTLYDRFANNPLMIPHWEEFTAGTVEGF